MKTGFQIDTVEIIQQQLTEINTEISSSQSIQAIIDKGVELTAWMAFTGEQMAIAKRIWREHTAKAYDSFVFSKMAQGMNITPTMANKYAEAKAGEYEANYQFCERVNRSISHTIDFLRTVISALKEEQKITNAMGGVII